MIFVVTAATFKNTKIQSPSRYPADPHVICEEQDIRQLRQRILFQQDMREYARRYSQTRHTNRYMT